MSGAEIVEGLKQAAHGNISRVTILHDGKRQVWTRLDVDIPDGHSSAARDLIAEQNNTIERLTARIAELEKALKPFANFKYELVTDVLGGDPHEPVFAVETIEGTTICCLTDVDFEFARTTLEASERGGGE